MLRKPLFSVVLVAICSGVCSTQSQVRATTSGKVIRSMATKVVRPLFPEDAFHNRKVGVAVAKISLAANGYVLAVEVIETPTASIADSVRSAVAQWQFKPFRTKQGQAMLVSGKLTFYFEIRGGKGVVLDPTEAGYVGTYPKARAGLTLKR